MPETIEMTHTPSAARDLAGAQRSNTRSAAPIPSVVKTPGYDVRNAVMGYWSSLFVGRRLRVLQILELVVRGGLFGLERRNRRGEHLHRRARRDLHFDEALVQFH